MKPDIRKGNYILIQNAQFDPILQAVTDRKIGYFDKISWKWLYRFQKSPEERLQAGKNLVDSPAAVQIKKWLHPFVQRIAMSQVPYRVTVKVPCQPVPDKPIIFAVNHSCSWDVPVLFQATGMHSYLLSGKQNLNFADWLFFRLNGTIWVDRKNKASMRAVKDALTASLKSGQSLLWFPEGTWNLTDSLPVMPLKWGIISVAQQADAQIIPVNLWYDRERTGVSVRFGSPIFGRQLEDPISGIELLRDSMAGVWWDNLSSQPITRRNQVTKEQLQRFYYDTLMDYPPLDILYEQSIIFHPKNMISPEHVFSHLQQLTPTTSNAWLFYGGK